MTANSKLPLSPGNFGLPFIGEIIKFCTDSDFARKRHAEFGPVFKTKLLGSPTIFIKGPEGNRFILSHEAYSYSYWPTIIHSPFFFIDSESATKTLTKSVPCCPEDMLDGLLLLTHLTK